MAKSQTPKIYSGMLKRELLEVADRLGMRGVKKLRKAELIQRIQATLKRKSKSEGQAPGAKEGSSAKKTRGTKKMSEPQTTKRTAKPAPAEDVETTPSMASREAGAAAPADRPTEGADGGGVSPRPEPMEGISYQSRVTAAKYRVGIPYAEEELRQVDSYLPSLPDGYGEDRLVLLPRDPHWLYTYWDLKNETKDEARRRGGKNLSLRLFELHDGELEPMAEHWCQEVSRSWYLQVPSPGRTYVVEIGYRAVDGSWLSLLRSNTVRVPPAAPSALVSDQFMTLPPDQPLPGSAESRKGAVGAATPAPVPATGPAAPEGPSATEGAPHEEAFRVSGGGQGPLPGSVDVPPGGPGGPEVGSPRVGPPWAGSAGLGRRGGPEEEERGFWLVADAELVVFGATEPGARVTMGGQRVRLRGDGTFSARMAFPDGEIRIPIVATGVDGEEQREIAMRFERATSDQRSDE